MRDPVPFHRRSPMEHERDDYEAHWHDDSPPPRHGWLTLALITFGFIVLGSAASLALTMLRWAL